MDTEEKEAALRYGTHASNLKEAEFIHTELDKHVHSRHASVSPLKAVNALQKMWLSPVAVIPQVGRRPCLIFDFTWIRINEATKRLSPMEAMRFRGTLQCILRQVLTADPRLGLVYLRKVDMANAYIWLWVRMEDYPSITFLIPNKYPCDPQLVEFQLFLPMGYVDISPYFCMATNTVSDLANEAISRGDVASAHRLEQAAEARATRTGKNPYPLINWGK